MPNIQIGCWVSSSKWKEAVVVGTEGEWVIVRYKARRMGPEGEVGDVIFVLNSTTMSDCTFSREADEEAQKVLLLTGPYGEGEVGEREFEERLLRELGG